MTTDTFAGSTTRHGTPSGYNKHQALNERPCDACYRAKQEYDARRLEVPARRQRSRDLALAQHRALSRLRALHPGIYRLLYEEEKQKILKERASA